MNYWLLKTEPSTFSWDNLVKQGVSMWDGVRNYQARNNLRKMKKGDVAFFYHSGDMPEIVGIAEVVKEHYPDPTAKVGDWSAVDIKPLKKFRKSLSLKEIKSNKKLGNMVLVKNTRLSVQPVTLEEYQTIIDMLEKGK